VAEPIAAFVDTNVLLDLVTNDPVWANWSIRQLDVASSRGRLAINDMVYAELSVGFDEIELLDRFLASADLEIVPIPRAALFLAGKTLTSYRARRGTQTSILPDFFIGAHAAILDVPLLTRDVRRYKTYFPRLVLVTP
jgi:predicted nucleic acid-binding protein